MFYVVETVIPVTKNDEVLLELAGSLGVTEFNRYSEAQKYINKWFKRARESAIHDVVFHSETKLVTIEYDGENGDMYHVFDIQYA